MATFQRYSDIDLDLPIGPTTGDLIPLVDVAAVKRALRNLVMTAAYEVPYKPEVNSGVRHLLFENSTNLFGIMMTDRIAQTIRKFEPRVEATSIIVSDSSADLQIDDNEIRIKIDFFVVNIPQQFTVDVLIKRVR